MARTSQNDDKLSHKQSKHCHMTWSPFEIYIYIFWYYLHTVFSFFHSVSIGFSSAAQTSLSNLAARVSARFSIFSCVITLLLAILCDDRSMFSGSPKYDGESASGNTSMASMKSCSICTINTNLKYPSPSTGYLLATSRIWLATTTTITTMVLTAGCQVNLSYQLLLHCSGIESL